MCNLSWCSTSNNEILDMLSNVFHLTNRYILLIGFYCITTLVNTKAAVILQDKAVIHQDTLEQAINEIMASYVSAKGPGAVIGVIHKRRLIFQKGYGMANIGENRANHPTARYKVASVSKQFTAAAVLQLIRDKKIRLTDDIHRYLPEFPVYGKVITVADLLYHTSGIRDYMVLMWLTGKSFEEKFTNEDALRIIFQQRKLHFDTGTRCVYSNSNYVLLAAIVKRVTGSNLEVYAQQQLFRPLKMFSTGYGTPKEHSKMPLALSYFSSDSFQPYKNLNEVVGDGGMYTTLADLRNWDETYYQENSLAKDLLITGKLENGGSLSYGMGIMTGKYKGLKVQMHPGAFLGYRAEMLRFPEKELTVICLGNSEDVDPEKITREIADVILFGVPATKSIPESLPDSTELTAILGKYEVKPNMYIDITVSNGGLTGKVTGQPAQILKRQSSYNYLIGNTGDKAVFMEPAEGRSAVLSVVQKAGETLAKRPEYITGTPLENYTGKYYSDEQQATYHFFIQQGELWFKVGSNPAVKAELLKTGRIYFGYRNLEQATIDFESNADGKLNGFQLNSGRVSGLKFTR